MTDRVTITIDGHVAYVMLNRAHKYNALDMKMFGALGDAADRVGKEAGVRAVVLHGDGENFCAGIDTGMFADPDKRLEASMFEPVKPSSANLFQRAAYAWRELPMPVICAVQGITYGGGLQIALGADLRIAAPDTRFSIMETKWGLVPDMAMSACLRGIVAADRAKELAWSARVFGADEALALGIVTAVQDDPLAAARAMAAEFAAKSPDAIRGIKRLVDEAWQLSEDEALAMEARLQLGVIGSPNQLESVSANLEQRPAKFAD